MIFQVTTTVVRLLPCDRLPCSCFCFTCFSFSIWPILYDLFINADDIVLAWLSSGHANLLSCVSEFIIRCVMYSLFHTVALGLSRDLPVRFCVALFILLVVTIYTMLDNCPSWDTYKKFEMCFPRCIDLHHAVTEQNISYFKFAFHQFSWVLERFFQAIQVHTCFHEIAMPRNWP